MTDTYRKKIVVRSPDFREEPRFTKQSSKSVHSVHESKPIKPKTSLSSGKMSIVSGIETRANSGNQHMMRPDLQSSVVAALHHVKKLTSSVDNQSDFDTKGNFKSMVVLKSNQKPHVTKLLKNSTKDGPNTKMLSVVRGVKNQGLVAYLPSQKHYGKD